MSVPLAKNETGARKHSGLQSDWAFLPIRWLLRLWRAVTMRTVELTEAKAHMDELIEGAERGRPFAISVDGKPMLKVSHIEREELERLPKVEE